MKPARAFTRTLLVCLASTVTTLTTAGIAGSATAASPAPGLNAKLTLAAESAGWRGAGPAAQVPTQPPAAPPGHAFPLWRLIRGKRPSHRPGGRVVPNSIGEPGGYDPAELRAYLGLKGGGAGQTIAVTEAFNVQNPLPVSFVGQQDDITNALTAYDRWYRLRPACSAKVTTGCFRLKFVAPHGTAAEGVGVLGWVIETQLDVEMIHALAPLASIVVVEGHDSRLTSMFAAVRYARTLHPATVSNSWSGDEFAGENAAAVGCTANGAPCVFSSGDCGSYRASDCPAGSVGGFPAADPRVLAVGGTTLDLSATGKILSETAWADGGGGASRYEPVSRYQRAADPWHAGRGVPDVSFDADPTSGVAIYAYICGTVQGQLQCFDNSFDEVGGTSVGAPAWAAILAVADQLRAAAGKRPLTISGLEAAVYATSGAKPVADVTAGINGLCRQVCQARRGYDLVTGEGSPRRGIGSYLARH
jgi:subtilase family serine protease